MFTPKGKPVVSSEWGGFWLSLEKTLVHPEIGRLKILKLLLYLSIEFSYFLGSKPPQIKSFGSNCLSATDLVLGMYFSTDCEARTAMCLYNPLAGTVLQAAMHLVTPLPEWIISPLVLHLPLSVPVSEVSRETALPHHKLLRH